MQSYSLPYGNTQITINIPASFSVDALLPESYPPLDDPIGAIETTLDNPIGEKHLSDYANSPSVGIAINDKTRPLPKPDPLIPLLKKLAQIGIPPGAVTLYVASGTHQPITRDVLPVILDPAIIEQYRVVVHDCDHSSLTSLGQTAFGTPIQINTDFYRSDLKISLGNIEPHHFMGYSGGVKTAVIGLAGRETINTNHAMLVHPQAVSGKYYLNPMRQDIEEIGKKVRVGFSLGCILNEEKQPLEVFFGDPALIMRSAIPVVMDIFGVPAPHQYDLVLASPGGAPKDINLYQSQKGLTQAAKITKDGGWVILLAACPEGSGSTAYENYVTQVESHQAIIEQFQQGYFKIGPHKAFQIARAAERINIVLVSDIPPVQVKTWKLTPSQPHLIDSLIPWLLDQFPNDARIAILPAANRTMVEVHHG